MGAGRQPLRPELAAAVAEVARVCADAPRPAVLANRDPVTAQADARLLTVPLDSLNAEDLWHYASEGGNALNPAEVAYFLPRLCELVAEGHCPSPIGWSSAFFALKLSAFPDAWRPTRVDAVQRFAEALALDWLAEPERIADKGGWPDRMETLQDLLAMARNGNIAMPPLLARLETSPHLPRALATWSLRDAEWLDPHAPAETVAFHLATSAFSERSEADTRDTLTAWLLSLDVPARLDRARCTEGDPEWRDRLERALVLWP